MKTVVVSVLFATALLLSACSSPVEQVEAAPTALPATEQPTVALVMKTLTNPFFIEMERGAREAEAAFDIDLVVRTAAQETSIEQQIEIIDNLISEEVDAIVIAPGDSEALIPVLKKAQDAGIVIVNIDNQLDPEFSETEGLANVPFISVDNSAGAYLSAKYIADQVSEPVEAIILEGIRSAQNAQDRRAGAERAFAENENITVVASETANWKIDEGYEVTKSLFEAHPDVSLVFAANDMMALGVVQYLQEAGRDDVLVAGYDALDEALAAIEAGTLAVTIDQQAALQGYRGVELAVKMLQGEDVPAEDLVDVRVVTADTLD